MKAFFNEKDVERLLIDLKNDAKTISMPPNFTASVMDRIRADETAAVSHFEVIYKKFLIGASIAAAAAIILGLNLVLSYNSFMSEYAVATMLNGTLF